MTPDELIALADVAEGKWTSGISQSSAKWKLEILAPDLARLCAELGEALERIGLMLDQAETLTEYRRITPQVDAALAKLAELEAR